MLVSKSMTLSSFFFTSESLSYSALMPSIIWLMAALLFYLIIMLASVSSSTSVIGFHYY